MTKQRYSRLRYEADMRFISQAERIYPEVVRSLAFESEDKGMKVERERVRYVARRIAHKIAVQYAIEHGK